MEIEQADLSAVEQEAVAVIGELCTASGLDLRPVVRGVHAPYMDVELVGDDAAESFGSHGRALDALQFLLNLIVGRRANGEVRIVLDAGGYRARREHVLCQLAVECAEQVKQRQEECELDPLPPHERRIVHNALKNDPGVRTYSEGDEPDRHIVIAPR